MFTLDNFYKSKEWLTFRDIVIMERLNENGDSICECCGGIIVNKYDLVVHHIEELTDANVNDYYVSLNPENVKITHFKCHNKEHKRFGNEQRKQVYIVYGAPCSGKNTWVMSVAGANDLVVDIDNLFECISLNERYIKPDCLKSVVFSVRDSLYENIKHRYGKWQDAYIITTAPRIMDRERLARKLGASCILTECTKEICLLRAENAGRPKEWKKYIEEWFECYQEG